MTMNSIALRVYESQRIEKQVPLVITLLTVIVIRMNALETPETFWTEHVDLGADQNLVGRARGTVNPKATIITGNNSIEAEASTGLVVDLKAGHGDEMITTSTGNLIVIIIAGTIIVVAGVWSAEVVVVQIVDPAVDIVLVTIIATTIAVTILF